MKFACERCGKKYATAEDPAPGRVYKLKCKSCGHLIVVKASSLSAAPPPVPEPEHGPPGLAIGSPSDLPPELQLEVGAPHSPDGDGSAAMPSGDATTEISMSSISPSQGEEKPSALEVHPGYVDLFADVPSDGPPALPEKQDDPFAAAARASLPAGYGSAAPAPDPFAPLREDLSHSFEAPAPPPHAHRPPPTPRIPAIPKPSQQRSSLPIALIGGGVAVLVGILAFTLFTFGRKGPAPSPPPLVAQAPQQPPSQPPAPQPPAPQPPAPQPPPVQPATPPAVATPVQQAAPSAEERRAREEQRRRQREEAKAREQRAAEERAAREKGAREAKERERQAKEERAAKDRQTREERAAKDREAREARDREKAERIARERAAKEERDRIAREARAERDRLAREAKEREKAEKERAAAERAAATASAESEGGLTPAQMEKVLSSTRKAFEGCIQGAKGTDVKLDGRKVMLRLNIQNNGAVTYPTLDDVTLNSTDLGQCLKNAARLMVFPKFKGDTMHVEVPLVMR